MQNDSHNKGEHWLILGCGYLGSEVARRLLASGAAVDALTRNVQQAESLRAMGVSRVIQARLDTTDWHEQAEGHYDGVLDCVSSAGGGMEGYRASYVGGMQSVVAWSKSRENALPLFLYTGSTGVYAQNDGSWVDEQAATSDQTERGAILCEAEQLIQTKLHAARRVILRLAGIYGPGRTYFIDQVREGQAIRGRAQNYLNLIHRDDAASAILKCSQTRQPHGLYNLSDNHPATREDIAAWVAEKYDLPCPAFDDSQTTRRNVPNRRICSNAIQQELGWVPAYPSYQHGFSSLMSV